MADAGKTDYYEILQVSANAEPERSTGSIGSWPSVFIPTTRKAAIRTGSTRFTRRTQYISDPERRAKYDVCYHQDPAGPLAARLERREFGERLRDRADRTADAARGALHPAAHGADGALADDERSRDTHRPPSRASGIHDLVLAAEEVRDARRSGAPSDHRRRRRAPGAELPHQPAAPPPGGAERKLELRRGKRGRGQMSIFSTPRENRDLTRVRQALTRTTSESRSPCDTRASAARRPSCRRRTLRLAVERERVADAVRDVREVGKRRRQVAFHDVAGELLRIVGADGVDEVLIVRELRSSSGRPARRRASGGVSAPGPFSFFAPTAHVGLPPAAGFVDPEPALRAVEEIADPLAAFVVGVLAARGELEDRAVGVLEEGASACPAFPATTRGRSSRRSSWILTGCSCLPRPQRAMSNWCGPWLPVSPLP